MKININNVIALLGKSVINVYGNTTDVYIDNIADVQHTTETTLDWVNPYKANKQQIAEGTKAKVVLVDNDVIYSSVILEQSKTLIVVKNPKVALSIVGNEYFVQKAKAGIHSTAVIDPEAEIGENVSIAPYVVIGKAKIGDNTVISSFVRIYDNVTIGKNCFFKEGAIIGGAGFGFEKDEEGNRFRFPQIGGVIIGDYVEVGANTCIDRGALSDTIIKDHTKIDNLCHIAHNVQLGRNDMITACSEVSGSCVLGDDVWTGPNTSIRDQRSVGENTMIGIGAVVVKNVPSDDVWAGNPAKSFKK